MDLNLTNSQTPIVVSSNTTAVNDRNYTVVANATFTDPSPVEGKGFKVFVRNGTSVIGGTSYSVGSEIVRIFHSGAWANYRLDATDKQATLTDVNFGTFSNALTSKTTPIDADTLNISDSADSNKAKKLSFTNLKAFLKTYFDTIYTTTSAVTSQITTALSGYVVGNAPITGATSNKVTYDAKGLVTSGANVYTTLTGQISVAVTTTGGAIRYIGFSDNGINTVEAIRRTVLVDNVTVKNFYITTNSAQPATGSLVFTILKNGVDTGIVLTIPAGSGAGKFSETSTSVSFNAGDEISIKVVNNASTTSAFVVSQSIGIL